MSWLHPARPLSFVASAVSSRCACWIQVLWHLISLQLQLEDWLINTRYRISLNLHGCAKIRGRPPISSIKLRSSHPCKCVRWPCSLSRLSDGCCAVAEGRAQLRLCPVHVWGAVLLMSESLCLLLQLSHTQSSSFQLRLSGNSLVSSVSDWLASNLLFFPALPPHLPHISLSDTHTRLTG